MIPKCLVLLKVEMIPIPGTSHAVCPLTYSVIRRRYTPENFHKLFPTGRTLYLGEPFGVVADSGCGFAHTEGGVQHQHEYMYLQKDTELASFGRCRNEKSLSGFFPLFYPNPALHFLANFNRLMAPPTSVDMDTLLKQGTSNPGKIWLTPYYPIVLKDATLVYQRYWKTLYIIPADKKKPIDRIRNSSVVSSFVRKYRDEMTNPENFVVFS